MSHRNYMYILTVNDVPVMARRRKYELRHDIETMYRHKLDALGVLRAGDYEGTLTDITSDFK